MKRWLVLFFIIGLGSIVVINLFAGKTVKMVWMDLSKAGIKAYIQAPERAKLKATSWGDVIIKKDQGFDLTVAENKADLKARKKEIRANNVNKLKKFHVDKDELILYETEVFGKKEFHFVVNVKVGNRFYYIEDTKGFPYTRAQAELMLQAAKSIKPKK